MKTDRELLELAGLAAREEYGPSNNPLDRDDLALRLAVKLNMHVIVDGENNHVRVYARSWAKADEYYGSCLFGDDPYAATRRAIVRAAAEIGKAMK